MIHRSHRPRPERLAIAGLALALSACSSSFFQISPTGENSAAPTAKPTPHPAEKAPEKPVTATAPRDTTPRAKPKVVAEKPREKPAQKPAPEKSAPRAQSTPTRSVAAGTPVAPPPPLARRPEPIMEPPVIEPPAVASDSVGVARLVQAAILWDAVRLYQPAAASSRVAWDNATVRRLTDVREARSREQFLAVLRDWVATLHDPATRIERAAGPPAKAALPASARGVTVTIAPVISAAAKGRKAAATPESTTVITWPRERETSDSAAWQSLRESAHAARNAVRVVLDLRAAPAERLVKFDALSEFVRDATLDVGNDLASASAAGPSVRRRVYDSWPDERQTSTSALASTGWRVSDPIGTITANGTVWSGLRRVVIIADTTTSLPPSLLALVTAQQATLVAEDGVTDASLAPVSTMPLGNGVVARIRTGELLNADGSVGIQPDTTVRAAAGDSSPALRTALQVASGVLAPRAARFIALTSDPAVVNSAWSTQEYPIMGARLLGAFRLWSTLRTFHAYSELHDEDLGETFTRVIPHVEAATSAVAYAAALLDLASAMDDSQGSVVGGSVTQRIGAAAAPFRVRWIESRAIVTQAGEPATTGGIVVGDELTGADGYPMPAYVTEHRRYGPASNEWTRLRNVMNMVPRGPPGDAIFRVRDASGRERPVSVQRTTAALTAFPATARSAKAAVRELAGGFGYIDLDRVTDRTVDSALSAFSATRGLVLDARTSRDVDPAVLSRVLQRVSASVRAVTRREALRVATEPCAGVLDTTASSCAIDRRQWENVLVADTTQRYRGRLVLLVDERTQGPFEEFALALESATNTVMIGTPTAGASGAISAVNLPGRLAATFSGTEVRHADGRQLQRVGITPQVEAHPTVKGVRAGTDEVLDAAQRWLAQTLDPPVKRKK
jgi:hypothetical protein